jgi:Putative binding domain, N-terminal
MLATVVAAAVVASACGSSSKTETLTSPSTSKCAIQATADGPSFPPAGGSGSVRIGASRDCQWAAQTDAAWVSLAEPATGQGDGSVRFSVAANSDAGPRTGSISINDQRLQVSQAGKPCELTVSSNHESADGAGGNLSITVRASADTCAWTASSSVSWISIVSGSSGLGNGTVTLHVDAVTGPPRTANVTIAGQNVQVDQGTGCNSAIGVDAFNLDAAGGERQIPVTAPAGCAWNAQTQTPWITITGGATGSGPGVVLFRVAPSDGPGRSGNLIVAGRTVTVTQSLACSYAISPASVNVTAQATTTSVQVDAGAGCAWTAASAVPWIGIASGASGSGPGVVVFNVAASDGPGRTGTLIVAGRTVTVTQSLGCSYTISPGSVNVVAQATTISIQVEAGAGCAWTATSGVPWISIASGASGGGRGQVQIATAANDGPARSATITIAGRQLTVTQASGCTYSIAPTSQAMGGPGGTVAASVTTGSGCTWNASSNVEWISVTPTSGVGPGQATLIVTANAAAPRTGTVIIAGQIFSVSQASLCTWAFAPTSHELPASGGTGNVLVFVSGACSWTAVPNVSWIRITAGGSATGGGLLQFLVDANSGATARTGFIAIGGENYVVHESGTGGFVR